MFGVLVAGRLVQTNAQQVSATNLVFPLDNATEIQTICVFLTGSQPLPPGAASIIWLGWPPFNSWKYLGYLTNERPSAVFKLTQAKEIQQNQTAPVFGQFQHNANIVAQIGIELADVHAVEHQFGAYQNRQLATISHHQLFGKAMLENLFNYIASFTVSVTNNQTGAQERIVPFSLFEKWYAQWELKLQKDPNFWKKTE